MGAARSLPLSSPLLAMGCSWYLSSLKQAHHDLIDAMGAMDEITRRPLPDCTAYSNARWRLGQASLLRRSLINQIQADIGERLNRDDAQALSSVLSDDRALLSRSSDHIARWTRATIEGDWPGYCQASRTIRAAIMSALVREQSVLYPLLERYACSFGAAAA